MTPELDKLKQQLEVFQVCDSTFPIGSFNHSYGMETYLREGVMDNETTFLEWLLIYLKTQFKYSEALGIRMAYMALEDNDMDSFWYYDRVLTVSSVAKETRDGAKMIAKQMMKMVERLFDIPHLEEYRKRIEDRRCFGHPALVFALFAHSKQLDVDEAIMFYGYSILSTMVQNAVRAIPIGQQPGQIVLKDALGKLAQVTEEVHGLCEDDLGANMPGMELAQMKHEVQIFRLFMS